MDSNVISSSEQARVSFQSSNRSEILLCMRKDAELRNHKSAIPFATGGLNTVTCTFSTEDHSSETQEVFIHRRLTHAFTHIHCFEPGHTRDCANVTGAEAKHLPKLMKIHCLTTQACQTGWLRCSHCHSAVHEQCLSVHCAAF